MSSHACRFIALAILLGVGITSPAEDKSKPEWKQIEKNDALILYEYPVSKTQSLINVSVFKNDAQLGIAVGIRVCALADQRGFPFIRLKPTEVDDKIKASFAPLRAEGIKHDSYMQVDFLMEKPKEKEGIFTVKTLANLYYQIQKEKTAEKK